MFVPKFLLIILSLLILYLIVFISLSLIKFLTSIFSYSYSGFFVMLNLKTELTLSFL